MTTATKQGTKLALANAISGETIVAQLERLDACDESKEMARRTANLGRLLEKAPGGWLCWLIKRMSDRNAFSSEARADQAFRAKARVEKESANIEQRLNRGKSSMSDDFVYIYVMDHDPEYADSRNLRFQVWARKHVYKKCPWLKDEIRSFLLRELGIKLA